MKKLILVLIVNLLVLPISTLALTVNVHQTSQFGSADLAKLKQASQIIEVVWNSPEFKIAVLDFSYQGKKEFVQNNGMTNSQIYDYLMMAAEKYPKQTAADQMMDLSLEVYQTKWYQRHNVLGYTSTSDPIIHMARWFYQGASANEIAMNLSHEWCHKMGFDHDFNSTSRRSSSVPYAIGYLVRDLGQKLLINT